MRLEATIYPINKAMRTALRILEPGGVLFRKHPFDFKYNFSKSSSHATQYYACSDPVQDFHRHFVLLHLVVAVVVFEPEGWIFSIIPMILACSEVAQVFARWEGQFSGIDTRLESVVVGVGGFRSVCDCKSRPISFKPSCLAHFML